MATTDIPILNRYKKKLVLKRLLQTFLGGAVPLGFGAPFYIHLYQLLVWILPFLIGGAFTVAVEVGGMQPLHGSIGNGAVIGVLALILQITSKIFNKESLAFPGKPSSSSVIGNSDIAGRLLAEEDKIVFDSSCSASSFLFVIPPKRFWTSITISTVISSFVNGMGMWYSLPHITFATIYGFGSVGSTFLFIFSWVTICISHYALLVGYPIPETATYHTVDLYELQNLSRALHVSLFLFAFLADEIVANTTLTSVNNALHIVFCILPLFWLFGIIPPLDGLILWVMEQFLVFVLGGSYMSTDWRLFFMAICSTTVLVGLSFLMSTQALITTSCGFGYLLSTNITSLVLNAVSRVGSALAEKASSGTKVRQLGGDNIHASERKRESTIATKIVLFHCVMFTLAVVTSYLSHMYSSTIAANTSAKPAMEYTFIVVYILDFLCRESQRVYVFFGIFRSCLYPVTNLSQTQFVNSKKPLRVLGIVHMMLVQFVFPLLSSMYLSFYLFGNTSTVFFTSEITIGCIHGLRFVWQRPGNALLCFFMLSIINLFPDLQFTAWESLFIGTRLIILDASRDRAFQFLDNFWFALSLLITSWTDRKQRRATTVPIIILNVIFFPVTLVIVTVASILSAPLLPLFTLPIFLVGFPRTGKFWPTQPGSVQARICLDTMYYEELVDPISDWFSFEIGHGVVDTAFSSSHISPFYIVRLQDKTVLIHVMESGYGYASLSVKGLELQETSCHALEATRLDDGFDIAFERTKLDFRCARTNPFCGTASVTPIDSGFVKSYSDARSSLRGIVEHPHVMKQLRSDFLRSLAWVLSRYILAGKVNVLHKKEQRSTKSDLTCSNSSNLPPVHESEIFEEFDHPNAIRSATELPPSGTDSFVSFTSLLSSDDGFPSNKLMKKQSVASGELIELRHRNGNGELKNLKSPINRKYDETDELDVGSILSDSGYGLPAVDAGLQKTNMVDNKAMNKSNFSYLPTNGQVDFCVRLYDEDASDEQNYRIIQHLVPVDWNEIPVLRETCDETRTMCESNWLERCLKYQTESIIDESIISSLIPALTNLILSCDVIVNIAGIPGRDATLLSSDHIRQVYMDNIPWSPALDWLKARSELHKLVLKAYRYAVKLMYDQVSLGVAENLDELVEYLSEYDRDWYIGMESSSEWKKRLEEGTMNLFALCYNSTKDVSARILTKQPVLINLGRLNSATVRGIWANLALELIYATNDDEERYSIQAHAALLRNMIVQTADPPLGYPVYSSRPMDVSTFYCV